MKRIQQMIVEAKAGGGPYSRLPATELERIASRCGPAEVAEMLDLFAELAAEHAALPEWDGDSADDIARAEETFRAVLAAVSPSLVPQIAAGLESADARVRTNAAMALGRRGRPMLAMLRAYLATETDEHARVIVGMVIEELEGG